MVKVAPERCGRTRSACRFAPRRRQVRLKRTCPAHIIGSTGMETVMAIEVAQAVYELFGLTSVLGGLLIAVDLVDRLRRLAGSATRAARGE